MILRQFCARHGRTALSTSTRNLRPRYVSDVSAGNPIHRSSERDDASVQRIPGHPDDPSSILDTSPYAPTGRTREIEKRLEFLNSAAGALQGDLNAHIASNEVRSALNPKLGKGQDVAVDRSREASENQGLDAQDEKLHFPLEAVHPHSQPLDALHFYWGKLKQHNRMGSQLSQTYDPLTILRHPPTPETLTLPMLLANQTHLGHHTSLWNPANSSYIFGVRDQIHIISLETTYAYLKRAAKVVQEVARRGGIILFVGTRKGTEETVINSARLASAYHISTRWTPGTLTNGQQILGDCALKVVDVRDNELSQYNRSMAAGQHSVLRPDLVICLNPVENEVCLHECGLYNVPTIGVIDTDADPSRVTYPIPANDDSLRSIALIAGVLGQAGKEGQRLRLQAAQQGQATYDRDYVQNFLAGMEETAGMDADMSSAKDRDSDA